MSHSNSSLNCFTACMAKYEHNYILHTPVEKLSPHLTFGTMAHEVLYKAGRLRDDYNDNVVDNNEYYNIIPSEVLYGELKDFFKINNWRQYFTPIIKQVAEYEKKFVDNMSSLKDGDVEIYRELKLQVTPEELMRLGQFGIEQPIVGVVDLLIKTKNSVIIIDYKFSDKRKTQDDFDMNSQLLLYSFLIHMNYNIPLHNIQYGYIDIPKKAFDTPTLLTNGTLSRSKSQNVSQDFYEQAVTAIHGDDAYYNCKPGGYYYDCWCNLALNKCAYLSMQYLDEEAYRNIIDDLVCTAKLIDFMVANEVKFIRKYDAYSCKGCEYLKSCKKWLTVEGDE